MAAAGPQPSAATLKTAFCRSHQEDKRYPEAPDRQCDEARDWLMINCLLKILKTEGREGFPAEVKGRERETEG